MLDKILKPLVKIEKKLNKYFDSLYKDKMNSLIQINQLEEKVEDIKLEQDKTTKIISNFKNLLGSN